MKTKKSQHIIQMGQQFPNSQHSMGLQRRGLQSSVAGRQGSRTTKHQNDKYTTEMHLPTRPGDH